MTAKVIRVSGKVEFVYTDSRVDPLDGKPREGEADWRHWEKLKPVWAKVGGCVEVYFSPRKEWIAGTVDEVYQGKPLVGVRRGEIGVSVRVRPWVHHRTEVRWNHEETVKGAAC